MIGLIAVTAAGWAAAGRLAAAWTDETHVYAGPAGEAVPRAWRECDALVCFLALGATTRLVAPLLADKTRDPAVVCVDEATRHAVALLGGHAGGGNALTVRVAGALGARPVVTTATDACGLPGLDDLGRPVEGAVAAVTRAVLDGEPVRLEADATWPLPALPDNVGDTGRHRIVVTDRIVDLDDTTVVLRPPSLVAGVGASRDVSADEIDDLLTAVLRDAGLAAGSLAALATVDAKCDEPGIVATARRRDVPLRTFPAAALAGVDVPNPSEAARAAVGTPSVAEAAALRVGSELLVAKRKSAMATVAIARVRPRGRLALVGLGPGARDLLPPRAVAELRGAAVVVGLDSYLDQIRDLLRPGTRVLASGLGQEETRAGEAVRQASAGHAVALVGSGDAGVYAMAAPALEMAGDDIDVVAVPGITASLAAAALLGAPLGHDHVTISLSDLHTPWPAIERRVRAAAGADLVVAFYNPRSRRRRDQLPRALDILAAHRPPHTPVGVVRAAERGDQHVTLTTLADVDVEAVDMSCVVVVGNTSTHVRAGRMVTPRGYRWLRP